MCQNIKVLFLNGLSVKEVSLFRSHITVDVLKFHWLFLLLQGTDEHFDRLFFQMIHIAEIIC
jgi:hypothetical protein